MIRARGREGPYVVAAACDGCGRPARHAALGGKDVALERAEEALRQRLADDGWAVLDGSERALCPDCRERGRG